MDNKNNKNSNVESWPGLTIRTTTSEFDREAVFRSGILELIPQGTYYTGDYPAGGKYLQVCITRPHPEGSISFFLAAVDKQTGLVISSMIEFALKMSLFKKFMPQIALQPCEDKQAVERVLLDALESHKRLEVPLPPEFQAGMSALWYDTATLQKANLLLPFQHKLMEEKRTEQKTNQVTNEQQKEDPTMQKEAKPNPSDATHNKESHPEGEQQYWEDRIEGPIDFPKFTSMITDRMPFFDPNYCKQWDIKRWSQFINQDHNALTVYDIILPEILHPYIIVLKNVILPYFRKGDPEIIGALNHILQNPPRLSEEIIFNDDYKPTEEEIIILNNIPHNLENAKSSKKIKKYIADIVHYQDLYPNNPVFALMLHQIYWDMELDDLRLSQAIRLYEKSPERTSATARYFMEICRNNEIDRIKAFFDKSVLFEGHLPESQSLYYKRSYFHYYDTLAKYFSENKKLQEFDKALEVMFAIIDPKKDPEFYERCNSLLAREVLCANYYFRDIQNNTALKQQIIEKLSQTFKI